MNNLIQILFISVIFCSSIIFLFWFVKKIQIHRNERLTEGSRNRTSSIPKWVIYGYVGTFIYFFINRFIYFRKLLKINSLEDIGVQIDLLHRLAAASFYIFSAILIVCLCRALSSPQIRGGNDGGLLPVPNWIMVALYVFTTTKILTWYQIIEVLDILRMFKRYSDFFFELTTLGILCCIYNYIYKCTYSVKVDSLSKYFTISDKYTNISFTRNALPSWIILTIISTILFDLTSIVLREIFGIRLFTVFKGSPFFSENLIPSIYAIKLLIEPVFFYYCYRLLRILGIQQSLLSRKVQQ